MLRGMEWRGKQSGDSTYRLRGNPGREGDLDGTLQVTICRGYFAYPRSTTGDRGRAAAEPTAVVKSPSLDELASLKTTNNVNSPLHPTVPSCQAMTTGTGRGFDSHSCQAQIPTLPWLGHSPASPPPD